MRNSEAQSWFDKGIENYNSKNYEEAAKCLSEATRLEPEDASAFYNWGKALSDLARIEENESLFRESFEKYKQATVLKKEYASAFNNWGNALSDLAKIKKKESLFREAFEKYEKATEINPHHAIAFYNLGMMFSDLAEIRKDESLLKKSFEKYKQASQINSEYVFLFYNLGLLFYNFAISKHNESLLNEAVKCFEKSKKDILTRFSQIDKDEDEDENILRKKFLYLLLDSDTNVGNFFKKTIESAPDKDKLDAYKDAYILSLSIINQLHVKKLNEKLVAHYREKTISQKLLFGKSKFRLNAVNYSNDPTEGKTLLDYFYGEEKYTSKGKAEYGAFAGCFSFNYNSLNQFRLYGKEKGKEGTGLSLVFNRSFFSEEVIYPTELIKKEDKGLREEKYALFRCIYVDSLTQRVETVGQKEEYLFYREEKEKAEENYTGYKEDITKIIEKVSEEMEKLREKVQELTPKVVDQLLINLRYLTKHIAFKEEQECRIVKIYNLKDSDSDIKTNEEFSQMYVKYAPNVSKHIEKVYFGPKADGMELFQDILTHKGLNITCEKSKNILA